MDFKSKFVKVHNFRPNCNLSFLDIVFFIDCYLDNRKQHVYMTVTLIDLCLFIYWDVSLHCTKHRSLRLSRIMPDLQEGRVQRSILFCKTSFRSSITERELSLIISEMEAISSGDETVAAIFTYVDIFKDKILKASLRFLWEDLGGTC